MSTIAKLLVLFTVVPLLEVWLLVTLGTYLGFWPTIAVVLVTGLIGAALAKHEGLKVWSEWRDGLASGALPEEGITGGLLVLVGGVLLVTPGVLTDVTGLLLLIPQSRRFIAKHVRRYFEKKMAAGESGFQYRVHVAGGSMRSRDPNVIDTDGLVLEERRRADGAATPRTP